MQFHLVDRVDSHVPGQAIRAREVTSESESYWVTRAGVRHLPGALVLEAFCQAGAWLVVLSTEGRRRAALASAATVLYHERPVVPGDVLTIEGRFSIFDDEKVVLSGRVLVGDEVVLEAGDILCVLIEAEKLESADSLRARQDQVLGVGR